MVGGTAFSSLALMFAVVDVVTVGLIFIGTKPSLEMSTS